MIKRILAMLILLTPCMLQAEDTLLHEQHLTYEGAFRMPGSAGFGYSGYAMTYNPANNSLFMASIYRETMAEVSIPALVKSSNPSSLNVATVLQNWADPTEGGKNYLGSGGTYIDGGMIYISGSLVYNNKLIGATSSFYPGGLEYLSHWDRSLNLSTSESFRGNFRIGSDGYHPNHKAAYMGHIPTAYQTALGGDILTGQNGTSIVTMTSFGPSLWAFDGADIATENPIPANHLVGYPAGGGMQTLGQYEDQGLVPPNPYWSSASNAWGVVFPEGSKTVLMFGRHGTGYWCYKSSCSTNFPLLYPTEPGGNDARPFIYQVWAYNVDDLIAAKEGHVVTQTDYDNNRFWTGEYPNHSTLAVGQTVHPWNVVPYDKWELDLPTPPVDINTGVFLTGAGYDPTTQKIYLAQFRASGDEPVIHAYSLNLTSSPPGKRYRYGGVSSQN